MKSKTQLLFLAAVLLLASVASFAQSPYYVLTNDDNLANSATVFNLDPTNGNLTEVLTLQTGGEALGGGYYGSETQIITPDAACIFVSEGGGTPDIAAFSKATHYSKVGNYSNSKLGGGTNMPMIANAQGTLLYAAYETTSNIGVWTIEPDCSLSLANVVGSSDFLGSMAITHDGKTLVAGYVIVKKIGSFSISGSNLTNNGAVKALAQPSAIAITNDDQVVIIGTAYNKAHPSQLITASSRPHQSRTLDGRSRIQRRKHCPEPQRIGGKRLLIYRQYRRRRCQPIRRDRRSVHRKPAELYLCE
jgi:6-phosphogluconolactonase (cycloisomerase 2 family)